MTSQEILKRLRDRYPLQDGWVTMAEVTPPGTTRRFDLIALMSWQSRGHEVMGFEIKVSRSDWLKELATPAKAEPLVRLCSRWWIVAPPEVVKVEELPATWGLLVIHPEQVRATKQAPLLSPEPWNDSVWRCMLLRQATRERHEPDDIQKAKSEGWKEGYAAAEESAKRLNAHLDDEVKSLRKIMHDAEKATGVSFRYLSDFEGLGEVVRMMQQGSHGREDMARRIEREANTLRRAALNMRLAARSIRPKETAPS